MFNLLQTATDDQTALGVCVVMLAGAAFFVFVSFHLGPAGRRLKERERKKSELHILPQILAESERSRERAA